MRPWLLLFISLPNPEVHRGVTAYLQADPAAALAQFDRSGLDADPQIQLDRAIALHKLGRDAESLDALRRALELDHAGTLAARTHATAGDVLAGSDAAAAT